MDQDQLKSLAKIAHVKLKWIIAISTGAAAISLVCVASNSFPVLPRAVWPAVFIVAMGLTLISMLIIAVSLVLLLLLFLVNYNIFNNNRIILFLINNKTIGIGLLTLPVLGVSTLDGYIMPNLNYERFRRGQQPILMFKFPFRHKDGGSQDYFGISYKILYYKQEAHEGIRTGPQLMYNFTLPFRDQTTKEEVVLQKFGR